MFAIEDELHAEVVGSFPDRESTMAELRRLADVPWDHEPNRAPCMGWAKCGRHELLEYEGSRETWREISRTPIVNISAEGVRWL